MKSVFLRNQFSTEVCGLSWGSWERPVALWSTGSQLPSREVPRACPLKAHSVLMGILVTPTPASSR